MASTPHIAPKGFDPTGRGQDYRFWYFSSLVKRPVCAGNIKRRLGKLSDIVFKLSEPYPEAVGLYLEHGWGQPTEFIPWDRVQKIDDDAIFVVPPEGDKYPPFVDQSGWMLVEEHLMGKTILDMDGRRTEVVNDVHLIESHGRMAIVHVDISFNGFLRQWGLSWLRLTKDQLISWKYVQPLSLEDVAAHDAVSLSITRSQIRELPPEDLADALEELSGEEQQAVFSALDSEKAAETLMEAEPRAQRQIIASLREERAKTILSEMSVAQLAALFSVLPHHEKTDLAKLLPKEDADRIQAILSEQEATARAYVSDECLTMGKDVTVGEALRKIRGSGVDHDVISYIYIVAEPAKTLLGVVDLRELVLAKDEATLGEIMVAPVVTAEADDLREDIAELFAKYHYRILPVADEKDSLLGVIYYKDIMKGLVARARI